MYQLLRAEAQLPTTSNDHRATVFKILPPSHGANGNFVEQNGLGTMSIKTQFLTNEKVVAEEFLHALDELVAHKLERASASYTPNGVNMEFDVKVAMHVIRVLSNPNAPAPMSLFEEFKENQNVPLPKELDKRLQEWIFSQFNPFRTSFTPAQSIDYFQFMDYFRAKQQNIYQFTGPRSSEAPKLLFLLFN